MGDLYAKVNKKEIKLDIKNNNKRPNYGQILIWINEKYKMSTRNYIEWYRTLLNDWEHIFIFLTLILQTRIRCPKTYLLIITTLRYNPHHRPTANGILSYLNGECQLWFPELENIYELDKVEFLPGLSLNSLKDILSKIENEQNKNENFDLVYNLAYSEVRVDGNIFNLPFCEYYTKNGEN